MWLVSHSSIHISAIQWPQTLFFSPFLLPSFSLTPSLLQSLPPPISLTPSLLYLSLSLSLSLVFSCLIFSLEAPTIFIPYCFVWCLWVQCKDACERWWTPLCLHMLWMYNLYIGKEGYGHNYLLASFSSQFTFNILLSWTMLVRSDNLYSTGHWHFNSVFVLILCKQMTQLSLAVYCMYSDNTTQQ